MKTPITVIESPCHQLGKRRFFSMIEVVLALGLIAVGIIGAVGLFPVGLKANRDAMTETYAADATDQLLHYLSVLLKDPADNYENWTSHGLSLGTSKPTADEPRESEWTEWSIFSGESVSYWRGGANSEFYRIEQRSATNGDSPSEDTAIPDFSAIFRLWRSQATYSKYVTDHWETRTVSSDRAITLNVEVSWPAVLPYERRRTALYSLEVYKPE